MDKTVQSLCNGLKQHHCHCIRLYYLKFLACPARFERATYALEAVKMSRNNTINNDIEVFKLGVQYTPRTLVLGGIAWI